LFTNGEASEGRVYLYLGSSSGLSSVASGTLESDQASAFYGTSVSTAGDLNGDGYSDVVVGASGFDNVEANEGMAFVYLGTATGLSTSPHWTGESNQGSARYGSSVSSAGDVNGDGFSDLVVGAEYYANGQAAEGGAFLYLGSASGLSTSSNWTGESNQASARYGAPVGSAGDINGDGYSDVIVGAHYFDNNEIDEGRAYLYLGSSSGLSAMPNWTGESDQDDAYYGFSAGTAGDVDGDGYSDVVVGAYFFDNGESDEGKVFLYRGSAATLSTSTSWTGESDQMDASYGTSVSSAGDVNGDGYSDVIVGARNFANGEPEEGRAYVYLGTSSGLSTTASWTAESDYGYVNYGGDVSTAGDVNGDGYSDIIVGASNFNNGEAEEGQAFLYLGSSSGLSTTPNWTGESNQVSGQYGCSVSTAGDVNGDGYSDVIVGACYFDNGESNEGQAYLYLGSASGLATTASWTGESDQAEAIFGSNVSTAGDVNGDGFSDVLIGASFYDNDEEDEGRAYLYLGSSSGLSTTASWIGESNQASSEYSYGLSTAGDVNGDSFSDVIVGAWWYENGETREGRAYLYLGSATGLSTTANWTGESDQAFALYGRSVDTAGDVNGDGFSDVLVGVSGFSNGQGSEGRTYLYLGSATGLASTSSWTGEGNQVSASYGSSVSTAGDVNGDGYSDVIVGAFFVSNGQGNEGQAYLYLGNEPGGRAVAARQLTTANTPLQVLGNSGSSSYKIRLTAYSPAGRSWVRLIWESKPLGTPFDNTGLGIGAWSDSGIAGVTRTETVTGLTLNTPYHWRARVETFPQIYSSWYSVGNNGAQEGDIRYYLAPTATPTAVPTSTATPPATSTPTPTMTPTPQGGDATPIPPTPTPVTIAPGARNLPAPQIRVDGDDATITLPLVTPNLTGRARTQALKLLLERGLTKAQANKALKDLIVTYVVKITNVGVSSVEDVEPLGRSIIIRSRNNQISRQNLPPGNYSTSYTVQIATRKPPVLLGTTKSSESTRFSVPRQPE
jgi:hypothetical protein